MIYCDTYVNVLPIYAYKLLKLVEYKCKSVENNVVEFRCELYMFILSVNQVLCHICMANKII